MPYAMRKVRGKSCYTVYNKQNKRVFSKCSTKKNAESQIRLLNAIQYNNKFVVRGSRSTRKNRSK